MKKFVLGVLLGLAVAQSVYAKSNSCNIELEDARLEFEQELDMIMLSYEDAVYNSPCSSLLYGTGIPAWMSDSAWRAWLKQNNQESCLLQKSQAERQAKNAMNEAQIRYNNRVQRIQLRCR